MTNPSPYDSGHDSSYSNASGPGHPPSSRGNSHLDDQVDRYIRDQRVAPSSPTTPPQTGLPYLNHTLPNNATATSPSFIASLPTYRVPSTLDPALFATARAYISDIAHSDPAHQVIYSTLPTRFRNLVLTNVPTASDLPTTNTAPYLDYPYIDPLPPPPLVQDPTGDDEPPPLITLTDDEHNILTHRHHPRPTQTTNTPDDHLLFDIRVTKHTYGSDSTPPYPELDDASDEEHLPYWLAQAPPTPPLAAPSPPANLTDA